jgi:transposase
MSKPILGVDVSKLDLSLSLLIDNKQYQTKIENNQQGFKVFVKWLQKYKITQVTACMEATGRYGQSFADFLYHHNHEVSVVNPSCIQAFAKSKLSRHKTDAVDSVLIAEYASKNDLLLYIPKSQELQTLQDLYRCSQNLKAHYMQTQNYLENKEHLSPSVSSIYGKLAKPLMKAIHHIESEMDNLLTHTIALKNKVEYMQTIPGIGKTTAVAILAESPAIESFSNARQLAAYAGLTPKHRTSGTSVRGKSSISKIGSSKLRKALYFPAIVAKNHNPLFKKCTE